MPNRRCFVPGCKSGYDSDKKERKSLGKKNLSLFRAPKEAELLQKWQKAIPRSDRNISNIDAVCELHFADDDVERAYVTKLSDGNIHVIERERPGLKKGAIPTIFPNLPKYLSNQVKKRSPPTDRNCLLQDHEKIKFDQSAVDVQVSENELRDFSFSILTDNLGNIQKLNKWWGITEHIDFIICVKWDDNFKAEKKIILDNNLKFKVFLYDTEVKDIPPVNLNSLEDVTSLLQIVDEYICCASIIKGSLDNEMNPAKKRDRRKRKKISKKTPSNIVNEAAQKSQINNNLVTPSGLNLINKISNEISSSQTQSSVYIKIEKPWEEEYNYVFNPADSKFKDYDETQAGKHSLKTPRGSSVSMYEKPLKIEKRDELFGKLVASEISDLYDNSELYAKTKQAVLNVLVQAHYEQMKLNDIIS